MLCCSDGLVLGLHIVLLESYVGPANTDVKLTPSDNLTWAELSQHTVVQLYSQSYTSYLLSLLSSS